MSTLTAEEFSRLYEQANSAFDVSAIAKLYADTFMFGNPQGFQVVKKEDFVKILPRRKEFVKAAGLLSSRVESVESSKLDSKYTLVKTVWKMRIRTSQGDEVTRNTSTTYILSAIEESFEIIFQIDHQDLMKTVQEVGAKPAQS